MTHETNALRLPRSSEALSSLFDSCVDWSITDTETVTLRVGVDEFLGACRLLGRQPGLQGR